MTEFKIIEDNIINYNGNNQLYIMIIKVNGRYYVEINTRTKHIGRKLIYDRKTSDFVVDQLIQCLSKYSTIQSALDVLNHAFKTKYLNEFMFLVKVMNQEYFFEEVFIIQKRFRCSNQNVSCLDDIDEAIEITNTIPICFPEQQFPIGYFQIANKTIGSKYIFVISEYSFRD